MKSTIKPAVWFLAIRTNSGTDVFTERLVEGLQHRGNKTEISWLPHRAEYAPISVEKPQTPAWANIVHVNSWLPKRFLPATLPIVATLHSCVHDPALRKYKSWVQNLYHKHWIYKTESEIVGIADQVVAVSHYTAQKTSTAFERNNIFIIHNAIDLSGPFNPSIRTKSNRIFRLLYIGNWSRLKGVSILAKIMEELGNDFELHYTSDRHELHKRYTLPSNCHCIGRFNDTDKLVIAYQNADALLFPSRHEGFGLVALEAQACALPVIATRIAAIPEIIEDGKTGILCPQDDVNAFADAARKLAIDSNLWKNMRRAARVHIEQNFNLESMIDDYYRVYLRCLEKAQSCHPSLNDS